MRTAIVIAAIAFTVFPASGRNTTNTTWGKTGISYEQYQRDSVDCAYAGYYRDVSKDEPAVKFITGWRAADTALNMPGGNGDSWGAAIARTQPDHRIAELMALQTKDVEVCLLEKGYRKVNLTRSEIRKLSKLQKGSENRRFFLYSVGSR